MFFIQIRAEHVNSAAVLAQTKAEIEQQIRDVQATLDESDRALSDVERIQQGISPEATGQ
jgi:chaperonin cofactor prefoldin